MADFPPPGTDRDFLVRSEEQLLVSTVRVPAGTARLEKFVVTETQTITVQVSHEEYRLAQDPIGAKAPPQLAGRQSQLNTGRWLYLNREEVIVSKKVVAVERVRLEIYPVTEQRRITDTVRKERIDAEQLDRNPTPRQ